MELRFLITYPMAGIAPGYACEPSIITRSKGCRAGQSECGERCSSQLLAFMMEQKPTYKGSGKLILSQGPQAECSLARTCSLGPQTHREVRLKVSIHFNSFSAARTSHRSKQGRKEKNWRFLIIRLNRNRHRKSEPDAPEWFSVCTHGTGKPRMTVMWM